MFDPAAYFISIQKVVVDGETLYRALAQEFPDLEMYGDTFEEAYDLILSSIETFKEMADEDGETLPAPTVVTDDFSGRITLRIAKTLHRDVSILAEQEGVSLNHFLSDMVATCVGAAQGAHFSAVSARAASQALHRQKVEKVGSE